MTSEIADVRITTDANNLVIQPQRVSRRERGNALNTIRAEGNNSGQTHDLAYVRSEDCLADPLANHSAKANELIKAVLAGTF